MSAQKPIIFVSCGQVTQEEKELGLKIRELIDGTGVFEGYFAENQSSLEGVTQNIFAQLERCFGLICVMHPRGEVSSPYGTTVRASVWIEQEIAIAAFLTCVKGRKIRIRAYLKKGIHREGIRDKILVNPIQFEDEREILADLPQLIQGWSRELSALGMTYEREVIEEMLFELRENAELLSLDLSHFEPLLDDSYHQHKKFLLRSLEPAHQEFIKQAYRDIATYQSHVRTMESLQNYGARANHIHMYVSHAKTQAKQTVAKAIKFFEELSG
jgi:hypothetical protein